MNKVINEKGHAWWDTTTKELVKIQLLFDCLKQYFFSIDREVEYILRKQHDILQFNQLDDALFDKWMADIASNEQFEEAKMDENEVQEDEVQIIDTIAPDQRDEEDKGQQSILVIDLEAQDVDMIEEQTRVK